MTMHLLVPLFGLLALSAYCSAAEAAWRSIARSPISPHAGRLRLLAADLDRDPRQMLAAVFLVKHATNVAAVAVATLAAWELSPRHGLALSILGMTAGLLIVSEVLPARFAAHHRLATARATLPLLWLARLLRPLSGLLHRLPAAGAPASGDSVTEAELLTMVAAVHGGDIKEREKQLIHNIFEFDDTRVSEIMTPRADMFVVDADRPLDLETIFRSNFSRIPVIEGDIDRIVGILNIKDLLLHQAGQRPPELRAIMREPYVVPEHKKLDALLQGFKRRKQHLAVVVDEHGGVSGLVTLEDALEQIVGEISDETDIDEPTIIATRPGEWRVQGKAGIDEVNAALQMSIPDTGEYDTFSGYILSQTGRIPKQSEELAVGGFAVVVTARAGNRILEYLVRRTPSPDPQETPSA
jgi:CBS domain containing-hemolysin-like protein